MYQAAQERLLADNSTLRKKASNKVSVSQGLICTKDMATNFLVS